MAPGFDVDVQTDAREGSGGPIVPRVRRGRLRSVSVATRSGRGQRIFVSLDFEVVKGQAFSFCSS